MNTLSSKGDKVGGLSGPVLSERMRWEVERGRLHLLCSRNARPQKNGGEWPGALLARRTRNKNMLVRCAQ